MTGNPSVTARLVSTLGSADGKGIVRIEGRFDSGTDDVWRALTNPGRLARWLGDFDGDLRPGGAFQARFFASGWEGAGRVEVCDPPRRLRVLTTETGANDAEVMEVTLSAEGKGTVLAVEHRSLPLDQLAAYGAGLQVHVEDLAACLEGGGRCDAPVRWKELFPSYEAKAIDLA